MCGFSTYSFPSSYARMKLALPILWLTEKAVGIEAVGGQGVLPAVRPRLLQVGDAAQQAVLDRRAPPVVLIGAALDGQRVSFGADGAGAAGDGGVPAAFPQHPRRLRIGVVLQLPQLMYRVT